MPKFILFNETTRKYFTPPMGEECLEWSDDASEARQWVDLESCRAAAKLWHMIHGVHLRPLQFVSGPHYYSVVEPGAAQMSVVLHGF